MMDLNIRSTVNYLLLPVSVVFYLLSFVRKILYRIGLLSTYHFDAPVVVVGNITVGGSGKTPIVMALVKHFKQQGKKVGVVSRGYGGTHTKGSLLVDKNTLASLSGDEPLLIATQSDVWVMVNKNRAQAVRDLITQYKLDIVISDDGLQHYAMGRRVEVAVVDGERRFGNGFFLPAGPLREPVARLKSVDFVINNGAQHTGEYTSKLTPKSFINLSTGVAQSLDFFEKIACYAVAGIAHPQRFFDTLSELGILVEPHAFSDHYAFTEKDLSFTKDYPIIMSAKDCVKCRQFATKQMWYLHSEVDLSDDFLTKLDAKL
ncbi:Tetraacyldisaccharide 4'-kinase (EC 2.7.1.130) [uncultured Gammaproteobacteria bacterium]|nr:Tetraacyldisaccharide 4'-kinase (EC 2.7.1.130) [uncultured Gammaproteobacteria bacterium]